MITLLICIYILGVLGFGGLLMAIGREDYSWPVLMVMALGRPPLVFFGSLLLGASLLEEKR